MKHSQVNGTTLSTEASEFLEYAFIGTSDENEVLHWCLNKARRDTAIGCRSTSVMQSAIDSASDVILLVN